MKRSRLLIFPVLCFVLQVSAWGQSPAENAKDESTRDAGRRGVAAGDSIRFSRSVQDAAREKDIVIGKTLTLSSKILDRPVALQISLPAGYKGGRERYPLLIGFQVFDRFPAVSGIVSGLSAARIAPPIIVVSADLDGELFSLYARDGRPDSGRYADVMRFLREELIPYLNAEYRTAPYRIILGHSNSALFGLYALSDPGLAGAVFSSGPMFAEFDEARIMNILDGALRSRPQARQDLFLSQGDQPELDSGLAAFQGLLRDRKPGGLVWVFEPEPGENHGSLALKTLYDGLRKLFADWATLPEAVGAGGAPAIRAYKKRLADQFGYEIGMSAVADFRLRIKWTEEKNFEPLIALAKFACEERPGEYDSHLGLALAYEGAERWAEAAAAYETALAKARANLPSGIKDRVVSRLDARLTAVKKRLGRRPRP